jgi:hypothetical protein
LGIAVLNISKAQLSHGEIMCQSNALMVSVECEWHNYLEITALLNILMVLALSKQNSATPYYHGVYFETHLSVLLQARS